jgi:chemotaxis response regulator CheB
MIALSRRQGPSVENRDRQRLRARDRGLRRSLAFKPALKIAWTATNGAEAIASAKQDTPDLVLMDLIMPGIDGVEATRQIMANSPCAILVVTASIGAQSWRVFEAMGHGALDAVDTPELGLGEDRSAAETLLRKIETIGKLIGDKVPRLANTGRIRKQQPGAPLVAIGASSGGPAALASCSPACRPTWARRC